MEAIPSPIDSTTVLRVLSSVSSCPSGTSGHESRGPRTRNKLARFPDLIGESGLLPVTPLDAANDCQRTASSSRRSGSGTRTRPVDARPATYRFLMSFRINPTARPKDRHTTPTRTPGKAGRNAKRGPLVIARNGIEAHLQALETDARSRRISASSCCERTPLSFRSGGSRSEAAHEGEGKP